MAKKQTSIFGTFLLTSLGSVTLGLLAMYFGFYQSRIQSYESLIAEFQSRPTPELSFSFSVSDETESVADERPAIDPATAQDLPLNDNQNNQGDIIESKSDARPEEPVTEAAAAKKPATTERTRPPRRPSSRTSDDSEPVRGPAFPRTRADEDQSQTDEAIKEPDRVPEDIPDIDDPEMDDNPLIRALREASRRQAENPRDPDDETPPQNPFEAILNIQND